MLKGFVDFLAEIIEDLRFRLAVLIEFIENGAVLGFFDLVAVDRGILAFFGGEGNSLLLFENALDFFVVIMPESVKVLAEDCEDRLFEYFGNVPMKLVILREHLNFGGILMPSILPFEEFLIINIAHFFPELTGVGSDLFFNEVIDGACVVEVCIGKVAIVEGSVEHDGKVFAGTEETGVGGDVC